MIVNLYLGPMFMIVICIFLIRQCTKKNFIEPKYGEYREEDRKIANFAGKIFTGIVCCYVLLQVVFPAVIDTVHMVRNEYIYAVVEMKRDRPVDNKFSVRTTVSVYIHPEFVYIPEDDTLLYNEGKAAEVSSASLNIPVGYYQKGDWYIVRYLPCTTCGEAVCEVSQKVIAQCIETGSIEKN